MAIPPARSARPAAGRPRETGDVQASRSVPAKTELPVASPTLNRSEAPMDFLCGQFATSRLIVGLFDQPTPDLSVILDFVDTGF